LVFFLRFAPRSATAASVGKARSSNPAPDGLPSNLAHDRQPPLCSGSDHQAFAPPGNLLLPGERSVPVEESVLLGRALLPGTDLAPIDHHVVEVLGSVDADPAESDPVELDDPSPLAARATPNPALAMTGPRAH